MSGILLFGGTFDPIHHGHLIVARAAREELGANRVVLIPSGFPPHKDARLLSPFADRAAMCRLAVQGEPTFAVDDWEGSAATPSYTLKTVEHVQAALPGERLFWLVGMDTLAELRTWYRVSELAERCTLVIAGRPGHAAAALEQLGDVLRAEQVAAMQSNVLTTPNIEISATAIRERVRRGFSVRYLVPDAVYGYISTHGLYVREGDT